MNLFQLQCFSILAESLNFTQAASMLYIAQPALSRTISALEQEIGVQLFIRNTHNVTLTPAGEIFLEESKSFIEALNSGIAKAKLAEEGYYGSLKIGYLRDSFEESAVDIILLFRKTHPQIHLDFYEFSHSGLLRAFEDGKIDASLGGNINQMQDDGNERQIIFKKITDCAIFSLAHPFANRSSIKLEELKNENFVIMSRTSSSPGHDAFFKKTMDAGFVPNVVAQVSFVPSLLMMVAFNVGVSLFANNLENISKDRVVFVPLEESEPGYWSLFWKKENTNPSLKLLIEVAGRIVSEKEIELSG